MQKGIAGQNVCYNEKIMAIKITKSWLTWLPLLLLITAFLTLQWTTAHLHLGQQYNEHASHHQHSAKAHTHNLTNQSVNVLHQTGYTNVIVFTDECHVPKQEKQKHFSTALVAKATSLSLSQPFLLVKAKIPKNPKSNYFDLSIVNPRAPPQIS